jgi:tetratricopeptide (TPR) repeat protein
MKRWSIVLSVAFSLVGAIAAPASISAQKTPEAKPAEFYTRPEKIENIFQRANALLEEKDWAEAEHVYSQVITLNPQDPTAYLARGVARLNLENWDGAIADNCTGLVTRALYGPDAQSYVRSMTIRSTSWLKKGDPLRALVDAFAATSADSKNAEAREAQADALYAMGNLDQAHVTLLLSSHRKYTKEEAQKNATAYLATHKAIDEKANIEEVFNKAIAAQQAGRKVEAIAGYTEIIDLKPLTSAAWGNRGGVYGASSDPKERNLAIADFSMAITLYGLEKDKESQAMHLTNRGIVYASLGQYLEAVGDFELATKLNPSDTKIADLLKTNRAKLASVKPTPEAKPKPDLARAKTLVAEADKTRWSGTKYFAPRDEAQHILDVILEKEPNNVTALILRGMTGFMGYKHSILIDGESFLDKAVALAPKNADARYERGLGLRLLDKATPAQKTKAFEDIKQAVALGRTDTEARSTLVGLLEEVNDIASAIQQYNALIKLDPTRPYYQRRRASLFEKQKDWNKAIADRTVLINRDPDIKDSSTEYDYAHRGDDCVELKQYANAIKDFDKAIAKNPKEAEHYVGRARAKRLSGDKAGALADYTKGHSLDDTIPSVKADLSDADKADDARKDTHRHDDDDEGGSSDLRGVIIV